MDERYAALRETWERQLSYDAFVRFYPTEAPSQKLAVKDVTDEGIVIWSAPSWIPWVIPWEWVATPGMVAPIRRRKRPTPNN